jgi:putative ABC transport system permease protein
MLKDIRYSVRLLLKKPGFTTLVVLTLALGIGANSLVFSLVWSTILRPLPVKQPDELVVLATKQLYSQGYDSVSYPDYVDYAQNAQSFSGLIAYTPLPLAFSVSGQNERIWSEIVTANYFSLLGVRPAVGRIFGPDDDRAPGSSPVAVLSYSLWQQRFNSDQSVVGRSITLNGHAFTVVGVAPKGFQGVYYIGFTPSLWIPMMMQGEAMPGQADLLQQRGKRWLRVMGRLKPNISAGMAQAEMGAISAQLQQAYQDTNKDFDVVVFPEMEARPEPGASSALIISAAVLLAIVMLVLIIACSNVANLLMVRSLSRRKEVAIKLSLGATRFALVRQFLTESVLLSMAGGCFGLLLAFAGNKSLMAIKLPTDIPFALDLRMDTRVLAATFIISFVTGIVFGLTPTLQIMRTDLVSILKSESGSVVGGRKRKLLRSALVASQLAVSTVVLVVAGLFLLSMEQARRVSPGFSTEDGLLLSVDPNLHGYDEKKVRNFYRTLTDRLKALPDVKAAGYASPLPLDYVSYSETIEVGDRNFREGENESQILRSIIGPGYFEATGTLLVSGREFTENDGPDAPRVVIVNETLAKRYWPEQDPVGRRLLLKTHGGPVPLMIVGIAKDGKYRLLGESSRPYMYLPFLQNFVSEPMTFIVRTAGDPAALLGSTRQAVQSLDASLPVFDSITMRQFLSRALIWSRLSGVIFSVFGILALIMAIIGLYGLISYDVTQRYNEIGIRMALGAEHSDVIRLIVGQGLRLALIGLTVGLLLTFGATRVLSSLLYGVSPTNATVLTSVLLLLLLLALIAAYIPARRVTRVSPLVALRTL